jgi:ATP-dependent DNA helicase PIF1
MTINKSQGQSFSKVRLYMSRPVFTHGQPYVALSHVKSKKSLKVVVLNADGNLSKTTINVVYKEVLQGICQTVNRYV